MKEAMSYRCKVVFCDINGSHSLIDTAAYRDTQVGHESHFYSYYLGSNVFLAVIEWRTEWFTISKINRGTRMYNSH